MCAISLLVFLGSILSAHGREEVSFSQEIQPVINEKCLKCHFGGRASFDMTRDDSYKQLHKYIQPGRAESSVLYVKMKKGHPLLAPMTPGELAILKEWISQGGKKK